MAGILGTDNDVWIFADETTYGTDAVNAAIGANSNLTYLAVNNDSTVTPEGNTYRPNQARPSQDGIAHTFVKRRGSGTINVPMRGGVGTPNLPNYASLMEAAGFVITDNTTNQVFTLGTNNDSSVSGWHLKRNLTNSNWRLQRILGVLMKLALSWTVGEESVLAFEFLSKNYPEWDSTDRAWFDSDGDPTLDSSGSSVTYTGTASADTAERLICKSMTLTVASTTYACSGGSLDTGMTLETIDVGNGDPLASRVIRSRGDNANATGNLAMEMVDDGDVANYGTALNDVLTKYQASTEAALQVIWLSANRRITLDLPKIQFTRPTERPNNGAMGWDLGFNVNGDYATNKFGDNAIKFTFDDAP